MSKMKKYTRKLRKKLDKKKIKMEEIDIMELKKLRNKARLITDKRIKKKSTYKIWDVVCVVLIATICNCNDWEEIQLFAEEHREWLRNFLQLTGGIPTPTTYKNIMSIINAKELQEFCMYAYEELIEKARKNGDIYHFDGKVERGSSRKTDKKNNKIKPLNVLNVYSEGAGVCIEQEMIEEKTNEITAIPDVIKRLNLKGIVCTWDALNTQKEIVKTVIESKGDYIGALKGNQGNFYQDVIDYFDEDRLLIIKSGYEGGYLLSRENNHSQIITYEYYQTEKISWYTEYRNWEKLKSIGLVVKTIEDKAGNKTTEKRYYISSLLLNIELFSRAIRSHWSVENKLHWQMDFTFKCDNNTTVDKKALYNLQILKKNALSILNLVKDEYKKSMKKIRFIAGMKPEKELPKLFYIAKKKGWNFDKMKA
jgi:predicted transposase YbfD/YdcC